MPDWDENSEKLYQNLEHLLTTIRDQAMARDGVSIAVVQAWHQKMMQGLKLPHERYSGRFRGQAGLENCEVRIGPHRGVKASEVADSLVAFEQRLQTVIEHLDTQIPDAVESPDQLAAVIDVCAWSHAEWIRIHPFANGNGRTARLWSNFLAMRYGIPPFIRLRPRPNSGYAAAGNKAMQGQWEPTVEYFRLMLADFLVSDE